MSINQLLNNDLSTWKNVFLNSLETNTLQVNSINNININNVIKPSRILLSVEDGYQAINNTELEFDNSILQQGYVYNFPRRYVNLNNQENQIVEYNFMFNGLLTNSIDTQFKFSILNVVDDVATPLVTVRTEQGHTNSPINRNITVTGMYEAPPFSEVAVFIQKLTGTGTYTLQDAGFEPGIRPFNCILSLKQIL